MTDWATGVEEMLLGFALMLLGLLMFVWRRFDVLALLVAVLALVEARRRA